MKRAEIRLLGVLTALVALSITIINASVFMDRAGRRADLARRFSKAASSFNPATLFTMRVKLEEMKAKAIAFEGLDPLRADSLALGQIIKDDISKRGMRIIRYAPSNGPGPAAVDCSLESTPEALAEFLKAYDGRSGGPAVLTCRLRSLNDNGGVESIIRIGYE
jgi:hypothetical protein